MRTSEAQLERFQSMKRRLHSVASRIVLYRDEHLSLSNMMREVSGDIGALAYLLHQRDGLEESRKGKR